MMAGQELPIRRKFNRENKIYHARRLKKIPENNTNKCSYFIDNRGWFCYNKTQKKDRKGDIMAEERTYFCVDMKSFFASVECAERGLNPFETNLVVADESRGSGTICLAISPAMKALGVKNRCRLFEIPKNIKYIIAKPNMKKYIQYNGDIYDIYLDYMSPQDIHVYSIDESFLDVTDYLRIYKKTAREFAKFLINEIVERTRIPASVGIGTNLYLAKIALDIAAKKKSSHIGWLNEDVYQATLWKHRPLTDFWQIGKGIERRLAKYGIHDMEGITKMDEALLYKEFGINAELLIDHAWGRESCTIADIKAHKSKAKSIFGSQILFEDYSFEKACIVVKEMVLDACHKMMRQRVVTNSLTLYIGYSKDAIPPTGGTAKLLSTTNVFSEVLGGVLEVFNKTTDRTTPIRRIGLTCNNVVGEGCEGYSLFTNFAAVEKEKKLEKTVLALKDRFGKNSMLRAIDLEEGATARERNCLIGGHNA